MRRLSVAEFKRRTRSTGFEWWEEWEKIITYIEYMRADFRGEIPPGLEESLSELIVKDWERNKK